jgi:Fe2+ transport system protein FeoA
MAKLSNAVPGIYVLVAVCYVEKFGYRLLEMGFVPGEKITVIANTGHDGSVIVKIKGSKIALSSRTAGMILLKRS